MRKISFRNNFTIIFFIILLVGEFQILATSIDLTEAEKAYVNSRGVIVAASLDGGAPLHFKTSKGEITGVAVKVLETISTMTGLEFEYHLYDTIDEAYDSNPDIIFGVSPSYARDSITLSSPYMKTKTILFMNKKLAVDELENELFATIEGGAILDNIPADKVLYCNTREDALNAVEKGDAGYGYANEYSVAYYRIKNGYDNIITIPKVIETREYSIGLTYEDGILLSIINKAISQIDDAKMSEIIFDVSSNVESKVTLSMIFRAYGPIIFAIIFLVLLILISIARANIKAKKEFRLQNKRYKLLASISNECLFEYNVQSKKITLSEKCEAVFGSAENIRYFKQILNQMVLSTSKNDNVEIMPIQLQEGKLSTFKVVKSEVFDNKGKKQYIIGKIIDISEEVEEKNKLIVKSEIDGLTNIYNSSTTKKLINERLKKTRSLDAFLLIDCDKFKLINDNFGHLEGDKALKNVSYVLKNNFKKDDIIGRIGGDEFCVYMKDVTSLESVIKKAEKLIPQIKSMSNVYNFTFSIGIKLLKDEKTYEQLLNNADKALYEVKKLGGAKVRGF